MANFLYTLIIYPLREIIECIYMLFYKLFNNSQYKVGLSIIGVSIGITLLCLPLYAVAEKWQEKERETQKRLKFWVDHIKKAFPKGDEQYMMLSTYYRQNHYHPLMALRSSFGLLIQIPFFMAAYSFLSHLEALQGVSFLFIKDLGKPDAMFSIGNFQVNVLPIAMTLINIIAGAIYTKGFPIREKVQIYGMAAIFLVLLYGSPAGLVFYWTMNNVFSLVKNIFYKLKNPLKKFWICCCVAGVLLLLYLFLFGGKKAYNNILFTFLVSLIFFVPLIIRFAKFLVHGIFKDLYENQKLCLIIFVFSLVTMAILVGYAIPSFLVSSSASEFAALRMEKSIFSLLMNTTLQAIGLFLFWPLCIYALFNKKGLRTLFAIFTFCITVSSFINTFCFSGNYGDISTLLVFDNIRLLKPTSTELLINILSLFVPIAVVIGLAFLKKTSYIFPLILIGTISSFAISVKNAVVISSDVHSYNTQTSETQHSEIKPVFHLSKTGKNVVVLMIDKGQSSLMRSIFEETPSLYDVFTGFTLYDNTASFNGHTLIASPCLYGGYDYTPEKMNARKNEKLIDKHNEALSVMPRIFSETADYSVTLSDLSWVNYSDFPPDMTYFEKYPEMDALMLYGKYTDLWLNEHKDDVEIGDNYSTLKRNFLFFSIFKCSPVVIRRTLYQDGNWWSSNFQGEGIRLFVNWYSLLDYFPRLTDMNAKKENTFTMITNETPHQNIPLQAPDYIPVTKVTDIGKSRYSQKESYPSFTGAIKRIATWLEFLKANDVYDNTRIIMVSDHGANVKSEFMDKNDVLDNAVGSPRGFYNGRMHYHPLLFVKDFNEKGRWKSDETFMTNADVPTLALKGIVENPINPFNGHKIDSSEKKNGITISTCDRHRAPEVVKENAYLFPIKDDEWWTVHDNIFDSKNWQQVAPQIK